MVGNQCQTCPIYSVLFLLKKIDEQFHQSVTHARLCNNVGDNLKVIYICIIVQCLSESPASLVPSSLISDVGMVDGLCPAVQPDLGRGRPCQSLKLAAVDIECYAAYLIE